MHLIEAHISEHKLLPGDRLPAERELAGLLSASRASVREAISFLEANGRLVVRHGQGVFVSASAEDVVRERTLNERLTTDELFAMRTVLEEPAARWAALHAMPDHFIPLERALDDLDAAAQVEQPDVDLMARLDSTFHMLIVEMAGNRFLRLTFGVLQEIISATMETTLTLPNRFVTAREEHRRILDALHVGDADGAAAAVKWHINSAHQAALARLGK